MKTPRDKAIAFTYISHPAKSPKLRWQATLAFPAGADETTVLEMTIADGEGQPVKAGFLELAGQNVRIKDGQGTISYADFIKGKHEPGIWLHRKGMMPIPGSLTFA